MMVSDQFNISGNKPGDMQYALLEAVGALELNFVNKFAFEGAPPADMGAMLSHTAGVLEARNLESERQNAIDDVVAAAGLAVNDTVVQGLLNDLKMASSIDAVAKIRTGALSIAGVASERAYDRVEAETRDQKIERLWGEIKELNKKIDRSIETLKENGIDFDDELEKKRDALKKHLEVHPNDQAAQQQLNAIEKQMLKDPEVVKQVADHKNPDVRTVHGDATKDAETRDEKLVDLKKSIDDELVLGSPNVQNAQQQAAPASEQAPVKFAGLRGFVKPDISAASEAEEIAALPVRNEAPKQPGQLGQG